MLRHKIFKLPPKTSEFTSTALNLKTFRITGTFLSSQIEKLKNGKRLKEAHESKN